MNRRIRRQQDRFLDWCKRWLPWTWPFDTILIQVLRPLHKRAPEGYESYIPRYMYLQPVAWITALIIAWVIPLFPPIPGGAWITVLVCYLLGTLVKPRSWQPIRTFGGLVLSVFLLGLRVLLLGIAIGTILRLLPIPHFFS